MPLEEYLQSRLHTLDEHLSRLLGLLKEYELALMFEDDPRRKMKYSQEIERVQDSTRFYLQEYVEIQAELEALKPSLMEARVEDPFHLLTLKIDRMQKTLLGELRAMRSDLLEQYSAGEQGIVGSIIEHFDQGQLLLADEMLQAFNDQILAEDELAGLIVLLQEALKALPPASLPQQEEVKKVLADPQMGMSHKLKISLPIIPAILSYEGAIELSQKNNLVEWVKRHLPKKKN